MKEYYYHLTEKYWGKKVILKPKKSGNRRDFYEPMVARICVCPNIEGCLSAVYLYEMPEFNIYRTENKTNAHEPENIPDSKITEEKWIKSPTKFVYIGSVRGKEFEKIIKQTANFYDGENTLIGDGTEKTLRYQKRIKNKFKKLINDKKILIKKLNEKEIFNPEKIGKKEREKIIKQFPFEDIMKILKIS